MKYEFIIKKIHNSKELFMCFEDKFKMLSNIFTRSALDLDSKDDWMKGINDTINGELVNGDFGVQTGFGAEIGKEKTTIYCEFTDEEFDMPTEDFKNLSETWFNKLKIFKETDKID